MRPCYVGAAWCPTSLFYLSVPLFLRTLFLCTVSFCLVTARRCPLLRPSTPRRQQCEQDSLLHLRLAVLGKLVSTSASLKLAKEGPTFLPLHSVSRYVSCSLVCVTCLFYFGVCLELWESQTKESSVPVTTLQSRQYRWSAFGLSLARLSMERFSAKTRLSSLGRLFFEDLRQQSQSYMLFLLFWSALLKDVLRCQS